MNRATLAERYAASPSRKPWKTFVLEAHAGNGAENLLREGFAEGRVLPTEDIYLHQLVGKSELVGEYEFTVDHLNDRFWSFHTTMPTADAGRCLRNVVGARHDLDWMWLPSAHLSNIWGGASLQWLAADYNARRLCPSQDSSDDLQVQLRVRGHHADEVLRVISERYDTAVPQDEIGISANDPQLGWVNERINYQGRFMVNGDDFNFHQAIVRRVIERYKGFVEAVERRLLRWLALPDGGARVSGMPIAITFSRPIPDVGVFAESLFSSREPFRIWGLFDMKGDDMAEVEAVDLHVGQPLRFDITSDWLRVYLFEGGCGNSIARLVANLQRHFDGGLSMVDDELEQLLKPKL